MQSPPSFPPPAWGVPVAVPGQAPRRGFRRRLWIPLAIVVAVVLVAAATTGGYVLGRVRAASRQPPPHTVSAPFVQFRLASGWNLATKTSSEVDLRSGPNGYMTVQAGNARQEGVTKDADLFEQALYAVSQNHLRGSVGSCLPVTNIDVGGKAGEEVGFLFHEVGLDGTTVYENCELVWADVQGSKFYSWSSFEPRSQLPRLVNATQAMQRTAVWSP